MPHVESDHRLLLNCDLGESFGAWKMGMDEQIMPLIDMANIACGLHAGDPQTMIRTVKLARDACVQIGAHPGYPDRVGFGRRSLQCSSNEIIALMHYQMGALAGICQANAATLSYVKPHGALYLDMMRDQTILQAVMQAVASFDNTLPLMLLARADNQPAEQMAQQFGISLIFEAFADRGYDDSGDLLSRDIPGAVFDDPAQIVRQAISIARQQTVITQSGKPLLLNANSLCVHGDNPQSVNATAQIRDALQQMHYG